MLARHTHVARTAAGKLPSLHPPPVVRVPSKSHQATTLGGDKDTVPPERAEVVHAASGRQQDLTQFAVHILQGASAVALTPTDSPIMQDAANIGVSACFVAEEPLAVTAFVRRPPGKPARVPKWSDNSAVQRHVHRTFNGRFDERQPEALAAIGGARERQHRVHAERSQHVGLPRKIGPRQQACVVPSQH
jgi:hypothetical protein